MLKVGTVKGMQYLRSQMLELLTRNTHVKMRPQRLLQRCDVR